jgi:hypothetical protein
MEDEAKEEGRKVSYKVVSFNLVRVVTLLQYCQVLKLFLMLQRKTDVREESDDDLGRISLF